jgi:hypothetical protein
MHKRCLSIDCLTNDFQITDKIEKMRAAVISKPNIPHLGIVKVVVTNVRNIARYKIHIN